MEKPDYTENYYPKACDGCHNQAACSANSKVYSTRYEYDIVKVQALL